MESRLQSTGKSIIEEWQNSSDRYDGIISNDQFYEERAIDVGIEAICPSPRRGSLNHQSGRTLLPLPVSTWSNREITEDRESDRNQSSGTVRSIPIKDYRASLAQDMGTLRRSIVPQQQFETLVSEPERNLRAMNKPRARLNIASTDVNDKKTIKDREKKIEESTRRSKSRRSTKSSREKLKSRTMEFVPTFRFLDEPNDIFVDSGFYSRRTSTGRRDRSKDRRERRTPARNSGQSEQVVEDATVEDRKGSVDLKPGNVCKKISVYEGNARSSIRSEREIVTRGLNDIYGGKPYRSIGVPLVGMHNACGLPVIAHCSDRRIFGTLRVPARLVGSLRRVGNRPGTSERRNITQSKRKAPQPSASLRRKSRYVREDEITHENHDEDEVLITERTEELNGSTRKRILKRPSFKSGRNAIPYKQRYSRRTTAKSGSKEGRFPSGSTGTFGRSVTRHSVKRSTLYAKDEGNEAAEVLTSLCLNPLARTKSATNMMW